jgi:hypothetical protein
MAQDISDANQSFRPAAGLKRKAERRFDFSERAPAWILRIRSELCRVTSVIGHSSNQRTQEKIMETKTTNGKHAEPSVQESQQCDIKAEGESCCSPQVNVGDLERAVSVVAGGACIIMAPSRSLWGVLMTVAGCGLMYRAMTGHCFVYQGLNMNTAEQA